MFVVPVNRNCFLYATILLVMLTNVFPCDAQQSEGSLFVIKSPYVEQTVYNEPARRTLSVRQVSGQDEAPLKELGEKSKLFDDLKVDPLMQAIKKLDEPVTESEKEQPEEDLPETDLESDPEKALDLEPEDDDEEVIEEEDFVEPPPTTWNQKPMSQIFAKIRPVSGQAPVDQSWQLTSRGSVPLAKTQKVFAWAAPDIGYNPLYFEDVALERYGQTRGLLRQPLVSGFHFLKSAAFLPYYSLFDPVDSCDGPLGYCRPGTNVNCTLQKHYFGNPFRRCP